ncbi:hypothetical protein DMUE_2335 [Dictyocoela muelleri]|nr:hypothetical protein DMUE_2335 [Dictyocoela muelleri]
MNNKENHNRPNEDSDTDEKGIIPENKTNNNTNNNKNDDENNTNIYTKRSSTDTLTKIDAQKIQQKYPPQKRVSFAAEDLIKYIYDSDSSKSKSASFTHIGETSLDLTTDKTLDLGSIYSKMNSLKSSASGESFIKIKNIPENEDQKNKNLKEIMSNNKNQKNEKSKDKENYEKVQEYCKDEKIKNEEKIDLNNFLSTKCINLVLNDLDNKVPGICDENSLNLSQNDSKIRKYNSPTIKRKRRGSLRFSINKSPTIKNPRLSINSQRKRHTLTKENISNILEPDNKFKNEIEKEIEKETKEDLKKEADNFDENKNLEKPIDDFKNGNEEIKENPTKDVQISTDEEIQVGDLTIDEKALGDTFIEPLNSQVDEIINTVDLKKIIPLKKKRFSEVLLDKGIQFMDDLMPKLRKDTISKVSKRKEPEKLEYYKYQEQYVDFMSSFLNLIELKISEAQDKIEELETEIVTNFDDLNLREIKSICRQNAKLEWYKIRKEQEESFYEKMIGERRRYHEKLNEKKEKRLELVNKNSEINLKLKEYDEIINLYQKNAQSGNNPLNLERIRPELKNIINNFREELSLNSTIDSVNIPTNDLTIINDNNNIIQNLKSELQLKRNSYERKLSEKKKIIQEIEDTEKEINSLMESITQPIDEKQVNSTKKYFNFLKNMLKIDFENFKFPNLEYKFYNCKFKFVDGCAIFVDLIIEISEIKKFFMNVIEQFEKKNDPKNDFKHDLKNDFKNNKKEDYLYENNLWGYYEIKNDFIKNASRREKIIILNILAAKMNLLIEQIYKFQELGNLTVKYDDVLYLDLEVFGIIKNQFVSLIIDHDFRIFNSANMYEYDFLFDIFNKFKL